MENKEIPSIMTHQNFFSRVIDGVRSKAATIEELRESRNGAIRITAVPLLETADAWLGGGIGNFGKHPGDVADVCEREFVAKLFPDGSHTMKYQCEDGSVEIVDCYSYSAMKIAYLSWKNKFDKWVEEYDIPDDLEYAEFQKQSQSLKPDNGYAIDKGVILTTLNFAGKPFMRFYVSVSGAQTGEIDEECTLAGILSGQRLLEETNARISASGGHVGFSLSPDFVMIG